MRLVSLLMAGVVSWAWVAQAQEKTPVIAGDEDHAALYENEAQRNERMSWWRKAKFGMFIHYGIYSGLGGEFRGRQGGGEWIQHTLNLDSDTYAAEAVPLFKPTATCAEAWAQLAEEAGCRYMVLTTKHHEGFALFKTATTDYNSYATAGQDVVGNFVKAARKHGMRVGFYHSVIDWHHPSYDNTLAPNLCYPRNQARVLKEKGIPRDQAAYQKYLHAQVRELLTNYGKIDVMWWDYSQGGLAGARGWAAPKLIEMTRELQPGIIMNNRLYAYQSLKAASDAAGLDLRCGDFITPEKRLPAVSDSHVDWESCMTLGNHWGFNKNDAKAYKQLPQLIRNLQRCAAYGGNMLLNISPRGDGSIPPEAIERFRRIGKWMKVNGESIYESVPAPHVALPDEWLAAQVDADIYIFPPRLQPKQDKPVELSIADKGNRVGLVNASVLGQPNCKVEVMYEEPELAEGEEPCSNIILTIPASAWKDAIEGLPVIKLSPNFPLSSSPKE